MAAAEKAALRRRIRAGFPGETVRQQESAALCRRIIQWEPYRRAQTVGAYMPLRMEADVTPIIRDALDQGKTLALPRVEDETTMTLRIIRSMEELQIGRWGIAEPGEQAEILEPCKLDLLIVPLEGIDRHGTRLGKGGGYYDRLIAQTACMTLGAVMSWQWQEIIFRESWDQPLMYAADQNGIHVLNQ